MQYFKLTGAVLALALSMAQPTLAEDVTASTVVATVGGYDITVGHLLVARESLPEQYAQLPNDVLLPGLMDQLIQQVALAQAVGHDMTMREKIGLSNQETGYKAGIVLNRAADEAVTEEALQAAFDAKYSNAAPDQEFNASHILVETEEEAASIKEMLDKGEDFIALAKEKSTGPSAPNGGALGWFSKGMMVPEFEAAVLELKPGEVSAPVKTQFGWHIVKLMEVRSMAAPKLEDVREEIAAGLRQAAVGKLIEDTVAATDVVRPEGLELDPAVLGMSALFDK